MPGNTASGARKGRRLMTNRRPWPAALLAVAGLQFGALLGAPAGAQTGVGGHVVYQTEILDGTLGFGGRAEAGLEFLLPGLSLVGTYDRYRVDCADCSLWGAGGQVMLGSEMLRIGAGSTFQRYRRGEVQAGDSLAVADDWAFHLVAGFRLSFARFVVPFVEFRQELLGDPTNSQTLSAGVVVGWPEARRAPAVPEPR